MSIADVIREALESENSQALEAEGGDLSEDANSYAQLCNWKRELDAATKACSERMKEIEPRLQEEMIDSGMTSFSSHGLTIYFHENKFVTKKAAKDGITTEMVCQVLDKIGWGDLVAEGYSASALKSRVLETIEENGEIDSELAALLNIDSTTVLRSRKV